MLFYEEYNSYNNMGVQHQILYMFLKIRLL